MICLFPGLKKSPKVLQDTMGTYINPESLAASEVQVNGGYDPCLFRVVIDDVLEHSNFNVADDFSGRIVVLSRLQLKPALPLLPVQQPQQLPHPLLQQLQQQPQQLLLQPRPLQSPPPPPLQQQQQPQPPLC